MTQQADVHKKRDIPLWLGIALVILGVGIATWFIWSQVSGFWSGPSGVFTIQGVDPNAVRNPSMGNPRRQSPGLVRQPIVRQVSDTSWRARVGGIFSLTADKEGDNLKLCIRAGTAQFQPKDATWVFAARTRLTPQVAKDIGLTDQQAKQFKALSTATMVDLKPTPDQLKSISDLLTQYIAAPPAQRDPFDRQIGAELDKIGKALLPAAKTTLQEQYDSFRKTVTDAQWEKLKALATAPPPAPTPAPAPKPAAKPATAPAAKPSVTPAAKPATAPTTTSAKP